MAAFVKQVVGHQATNGSFDTAVLRERCDIVGYGVFGDSHANQFHSIAQIGGGLRLCRRQRTAQFDMLRQVERYMPVISTVCCRKSSATKAW